MRTGEHQYLDLLNRVASGGYIVAQEHERTGTGTKKLHEHQMRFELGDGFPLLTTKRLIFRNIALELLWILSGDTKVSSLAKQGVRIRNDDAYRVYLDTMKREKKPAMEKGEYEFRIMSDDAFGDKYSDLGPIYGKQRRNRTTYKPAEMGDHYGSQPSGVFYELGGGIDQIKNLIHNLKHKPYDRGHLLSARNVGELDEMGLRPCHHESQYFISEENGVKYLDCALRQRSGDLFLGVPYNIASYALLTSMIAQCIGAMPGELIHTIGDAHVYANHIPQVQEILQRSPKRPPILELNKEIEDIFTFTINDMKVVDYDPYPAIKAQLKVGL